MSKTVSIEQVKNGYILTHNMFSYIETEVYNCEEILMNRIADVFNIDDLEINIKE